MAFLIYLIGIVDQFSCALTLVIALSSIILGIGTIVYLTEVSDDVESGLCLFLRAKSRLLIIAILVAGLFRVFLPNSTTLSAMILIPRIVENETLQQLPDKLLKLLDKKTDQWVEDSFSSPQKSGQ